MFCCQYSLSNRCQPHEPANISKSITSCQVSKSWRSPSNLTRLVSGHIGRGCHFAKDGRSGKRNSYRPLQSSSCKKDTSPHDWMYLKQHIPSLIGIKVFDGNRNPEWYKQIREKVQGLSVFIPGHNLASGILSGAHGAYSNIAC